jgi:long-chain acyl-CoA synthetase
MTLSVDILTADMTAAGKRFAIDEAVIGGKQMRVWKNAPLTLLDVLAHSRTYNNADFIVYQGERISFNSNYRSAARIATRLQCDYGIGAGDRVAIAMRNLPEWIAAFWGILLAGGVVVPLNAWWARDDLVFGIEDSGARAVFVDRERLSRISEHRDVAGKVDTFIVANEDRIGNPLPVALQSVRTFEDLLSRLTNEEESVPEVLVQPDDDATIFYTSGTTGRPKGAVGTHRNACTSLMNQYFLGVRALKRAGESDFQGRRADEAKNVVLLSVPLFHVTGCLSTLLVNTWSGGSLVMMRRFEPEVALDLIEAEGVSIVAGVPATVRQVLDSSTFAQRDLTSVRSISYGGAPAPPDLVGRIRRSIPGGTPGNGYGLTETSAVIAMNTGKDYQLKPDSVGPAVPVCDVAIVPTDETTDPAAWVGAADVIGEVWVRGPQVVRGYWNRPGETSEAFKDGWFRTGDIGRIDNEGWIFIVDRAKDVIIRGGENIYSVQVEARLFEHDAVVDCAIIAIPDEVLGEAVGAVVVLRPGASISSEDLAGQVRSRMADYNVPSHWWFVNEQLPRNAAGKVLKRELRDRLVTSIEHEAAPNQKG